MSRRRCCCGGCVIDSDDFNRADSTDLGAKWTEVAGDWSISSNRLSVSSSNAEVEFASTSALPYSWQVSVRIYLTAEGDQAYVGVDDIYFACIDRGPTNGEWRVRIYSNDPPGTPGNIRSSKPFFYAGENTDYVDLIVTMSSTRLEADPQPPPPDVGLASNMVSVPIDSDDIPTGKISLGTGTVGAGSTVEFNNFVLEKGYEVLAVCPEPVDRCEFLWGPQLLPDGTSLDSDDWTVSGTYTMSSNEITFPGPDDGSVLTKVLHPYTDATTIRDDYWKVFTEWERLGAAYTGETGYVYFDGTSNYVKLEFIAPTGDGTWRVTAGIYIGGVLTGAEATVEGGDLLGCTVDVCVTPTAVVAAIGSEIMARDYTPTGSEFGVGASSISDGLGVSKLDAQVLRDVLPEAGGVACATCGWECDGCEDGTVVYSRTTTISGATADSCGDCSPLDGVFEGVYDSDYPCEWRYEDQVDLCGTTYDRRVDQSSFPENPGVPGVTDVLVQVRLWSLGGGSALLDWQFTKQYANPVDCSTLSDTLPLDSESGTLCDAPASVDISP